MDNYAALYETAASLIPEGSKVVELGCGEGQFASLIAPKVGSYIGVDISRTALIAARQNNDSQLYNCFIESDITKDERIYKDAATFVTLEVLEHLHEDDDLDVLAYIRKGCRVVLSVPSFDSDDHKRFFPNDWDAIERYSLELEIDLWRKIKLPIGNGFFHLIRGFR